MKTITCAVILLLVAAITSCEESPASPASPPAAPLGPDPVELLERQVATERQLRTEAEGRVEKEAAARNLWQQASLGLGVAAVFAFLGGITIGTRGRYHANATS